MIIDIQTQDAVTLVPDAQVKYTFVQDIELAQVGGGSGTMHF